MDEALRQLVRDRAAGLCEYCLFPEKHSFNPFQVDHIIAEKHGGLTVAENLAWSCFYCNTYKGPNIAGWNPDDETIVRLYHPRKDMWSEHFEWSGEVLAGKTPVGTVTVNVLRFNHPDALAVRRLLLEHDLPS
ncbi:HNH endonuclease signature motif containing protein [Pirellulales bacterium]|nr:HNH endonuclease signature motif containing protein [Pirellulales bacterium]